MFYFNPISQEIEWRIPVIDELQTGTISFSDGDLSIDSGSRDNDSSIIDQGERV